MNLEESALEDYMNARMIEVAQWSEPVRYDFNNTADRREIYGRITKDCTGVQRKVVEIADDLFEMRHPNQKNDPIARTRFVAKVVALGDRYGKWYYFPWLNQLIQYPNKEEYWQLLTFRNRELITVEELRQIRSSTIAHVGLSVGSHILEQTSHMALGNKVILADPDVLSVPNLNRVHAGMPDVGIRKTDLAGMRLSELNPYVKQIHLPGGLTPENAKTFALHRPNLIYEEVDHMPTKVATRKLARRVGAALIMVTDTGDCSMIDVERYDIGDNKPFLGRLSTKELTFIDRGDLPPEVTIELIMKLIGSDNISKRLAWSISQIGVTLGGISQLGTTASAGAAYAAVAGREILLGRGPATGRYKMSPQSTLHLK